MEENKIKDMLNQEKYKDIIASLEEIFQNLFIEMLENKKADVKENFYNLDYNNISLVVAKYYPRYRQDIINLTHVEYREENTYLDVINTMLSIYLYISDTYKEEYKEEEFYFEELD